jgi:hypothetical protein
VNRDNTRSLVPPVTSTWQARSTSKAIKANTRLWETECQHATSVRPACQIAYRPCKLWGLTDLLLNCQLHEHSHVNCAFSVSQDTPVTTKSRYCVRKHAMKQSSISNWKTRWQAGTGTRVFHVFMISDQREWNTLNWAPGALFKSFRKKWVTFGYFTHLDITEYYYNT